MEEKLITWQMGFEEPIFEFLNEKRLNSGELQGDEDEYFKYQTDTFKIEMTAVALAIPINLFSILYSRESSKFPVREGRANLYGKIAVGFLIPGVAAFGYAIYRRYMIDIPHEKSLVSRYYSELSRFRRE